MERKANRLDALVTKLQAISEKELTEQVLVPLFESLTYERVEYHGGGTEQGKDLVCWGRNELGDIELTVAQVKRYKPSRRASDTKCFSEIVTQLSQCVEKRLPNLDGCDYLPTNVYFITPYRVDTAALQTRFEAYSALRQHHATVIDGPKLAKLVIDKTPSIASTLLGRHFEIGTAVVRQLTNKTLLATIGFQGDKELATFHTDIDFSVGRITTRLFFESQMKPSLETYQLDASEWSKLKAVVKKAQAHFGQSMIRGSISAVETRYKNGISAWEKWKESMIELRAGIKKQSKACRKLEALYGPQEKALEERTPELRAMKNNLDACHVQATALEEGGRKRAKRNGELRTVRKEIQRLEREVSKLEKPLKPVLARIYKAKKILQGLESREKAAAAKEPPRCYEVVINGSAIAKSLGQERKSIEQTIARYNKKSPSIATLRKFLSSCELAIDVAADLFSNRYVARSVGMSAEQLLRKKSERTRLSIPLELVFDTGVNIVLLGEAGAGKTTALQMYARSRLEDESEEGIVVYAPLPRIVRAWEESEGSLKLAFAKDRFEVGIARYLSKLGLHIDGANFEKELHARGGTLLLDGVDEAIGRAPWLFTAIQNLSMRYGNVQIVLASRMAGRYLEKIPFLGLTLLPFTNAQRKHFVRHWFGPDGREHSTLIENHLKHNHNLNDIVRNPLLTTILCVLQENGIPLPNSEVRLYEERCRLLLGEYDVVKQISRMKSARRDLEVLCRKLAYWLHVHERRDADREELYETTKELMGDLLTPAKCERAVDELSDPCNVLVPMTEDGKLGFGHLRYQEYFAALELLSNRGIHMVPHLRDTSWKGALVLFAQMSDSLEWLIDWAGRQPSFQSFQDNLLTMVEAGPRGERSRLRELVEEHIELDRRYPLLVDTDEGGDGMVSGLREDPWR